MIRSSKVVSKPELAEGSHSGAAVEVGATDVSVGVDEGGDVGGRPVIVGVRPAVGGCVDVDEVGEAGRVAVFVRVAVRVGLLVGELVGASVAEGAGVSDGVLVGVPVSVTVGVEVEVGVAV